MPIDLLQLEREVAEQQLDDLEHLLNEKEGVKMDEAFIGFQIAQHAQLASKVKVFERHATSELKDVLSDGLKVIEQHQQHAEKLMKQIAKQASKDLSKEDSK